MESFYLAFPQFLLFREQAQPLLASTVVLANALITSRIVALVVDFWAATAFGNAVYITQVLHRSGRASEKESDIDGGRGFERVMSEGKQRP